MTFRVGQKVVCIAPRTGGAFFAPIEPDKGDVATVTNVYISQWGHLVLELAEFPAPGGILPNGGECGPGWIAKDFRPIVERKTSIEIFTRMLNPENTDA